MTRLIITNMQSLQLQSKSLEEWLEYQHMEENPTLLDDDLPDAFSDWISELTEEQLEAYATRYGQDVAKRDLAVFKFDNGIEHDKHP